ncbi:MAG: oxidoreductase [Acidobacteriota bacterium]
MNQPSTGLTVMLLGGTGLVGASCLARLIDAPEVGQIRLLVRRLPSMHLPDKVQVCLADFSRLEKHPEWFEVDAVVCALGTTIGKAGSQAAFRQVDFDYPLQVAQLAKASGARHFAWVSALGADSRANVFYNRVKGELEDALQAMGFESLTVARPSLLRGNRREFRLGERLALKVSQWFLPLIPPAWRPVWAGQVAAALVDAVLHPQPGWRVLANPQLLQMH